MRRSNNSGKNQKTMHKAVCDNCGKDCKVPFKPTGNKPIYCNHCFDKKGNKKGHSHKDMFHAICDECGRDCEVPFKPTSGKPIFCSNCFEDRNNSRSGTKNRKSQSSESDPKLIKRLDEIDMKLNRILEALGSPIKTHRVSAKEMKKALDLENIEKKD